MKWSMSTALVVGSLVGCAHPHARLDSLSCVDAIHANAERELVALKAAAHADPRDRDTLICLAYAQVSLKQFADAKASATRALEVDPFDALALRLRAFASYRLGEYQSAERDAERSEREGPIGEAYEICGKSQMRQGKFVTATRSFERWVGADGSTEARCWLAAARWESGDHAAAIAGWDDAARLAPQDPEPWIWKCGFLYRAGDAKGARDAAAHAHTLAPHSPQVLGAKARVEVWTGEDAAAKGTLDSLARVDPAVATRLAEALAKPAPAANPAPATSAPATP